MALEAELVHAILARFGADPRLRIWRANTGVAFDAKGRAVRFGVPGAADISGILRGGRRIEIEAKSPTGRQSPQQRVWQAMIEAHGGLYVLARSVEDVEKAVDPDGADR